MHIGGDEQGVAALVGHHAHPAHQIADGPGGVAAIRRAQVVLLPTQPGIIALFFAFLFQSEAALIRAALLLRRLVLIDGGLRRSLVHWPQWGRAGFGKEDVDVVSYDGRFGKPEVDAHGRLTRLRGDIQLFEDFLHGGETFRGIGGDDDGVGIRLAGDADFAVEPPGVLAVTPSQVRIINLPVGALLLLLEEKLIEHVFNISGTDVFEPKYFWGETLVGDGPVQLLDQFRDAVHGGGRGLDNHGIAPTIGYKVSFLAGPVHHGIRKEIIWIAARAILILVEVLQLFGDVLGVGVLEREVAHGFFLGLFSIERGDEFFDGLEVGFAGKDHQRVGSTIRSHFDDVLERFAAHFLVEWADVFDQVFGADVFQWEHADGDILRFFGVQQIDQPLDLGQFGPRRRDNQPIGALIRPNSNWLSRRSVTASSRRLLP